MSIRDGEQSPVLYIHSVYLSLQDTEEYVGVGEYNVSFNNLCLISFTNTFFQGMMTIVGIYLQ